jgi:hypothetical protein
VIEVYSPKLREELVPVLYRIAKAKKITMVKLVNDIVSEALKSIRVEVQVVRETVETSREVFVIADKSITKEEP